MMGVASKVAQLVKVPDDGSTKARMIIDLLRSGGNGDVVLPDRVVLSYLTAGLLGLMDGRAAGGQGQGARMRYLRCGLR